MSDEEEREINFQSKSIDDIRLTFIKSKLQELTRDKSKYNMEKLTQDLEFLQREMGHLSHSIADLNREIIHQISLKKNLNARMAILRSNSGYHFPTLEIALRVKERYEDELKKTNKSEFYRELARRHIKSICEALPQLQIQDEFMKKLQLAEDAQILAQKKREKFQENLNLKSRKQTELKQLLNDSSGKLPELEIAIETLRSERDEISEKKQRGRTTISECHSIDSPRQSLETLRIDTLHDENQRTIEQLEKVRLLLNYFHEKLSEHHLTNVIDSISEEQSILSSENSNEYRKEFSADIIDRYAGTSNKKKEQIQTTKKNRRKGKNIKHSSQMIVLYDDVRTNSGNCDTLPVMPLYDYEIPSIIKSLQLMDESLHLYLNDLSKYRDDSALDTFSETSSLIDSNEIIEILPQVSNIPQPPSSSSSDDKKTIVSSSSATSFHPDQPTSVIIPLTPVEELPSLNIPIERQISDEGYRSVRNEQRQISSIHPSPLLIRSVSCDSTEKVDQWLSTTNEHFQSTDDSSSPGDPILRYTCD